MQHKVVGYFIFILISCTSLETVAQSIDSTKAIQNISQKSIDYIGKKYSSISNDLQKQNATLLRRMQEKETTLKKKLQNILG